MKEAEKIPFPNLTPPAKKRWNQLSEQSRKEILSNVWCSNCRQKVILQLRDGTMEGGSLILRGRCKTCGGEAARVVEPGE